jgi:hypothetical protein
MTVSWKLVVVVVLKEWTTEVKTSQKRCFERIGFVGWREEKKRRKGRQLGGGCEDINTYTGQTRLACFLLANRGWIRPHLTFLPHPLVVGPRCPFLSTLTLILHRRILPREIAQRQAPQCVNANPGAAVVNKDLWWRPKWVAPRPHSSVHGSSTQSTGTPPFIKSSSRTLLVPGRQLLLQQAICILAASSPDVPGPVPVQGHTTVRRLCATTHSLPVSDA